MVIGWERLFRLLYFFKISLFPYGARSQLVKHHILGEIHDYTKNKKLLSTYHLVSYMMYNLTTLVSENMDTLRTRNNKSGRFPDFLSVVG
jgi:hypothetical protein